MDKAERVYHGFKRPGCGVKPTREGLGLKTDPENPLTLTQRHGLC